MLFPLGMQILRETPESAAAPAPEPEPAPSEQTPVVEPESWSGPSREEWEETQQYLRSIGQALPTLYETVQGLSPQPAPTPSPAPEYDPFDPESVGAYISHNVEKLLGERLQPYEGLLGMMAAKEGEALAKSELERLSGTLGAFDQDNAYMVAAGIIERGGDAAQALETAARHTYEFEQRIRADERAKYKDELERLGHAPPEVHGGTGATEVETVPTGPNRYVEAVERALARRRPVMPTG